MKVPVTIHHIGPSCVQCEMTKKLMDRHGIIYDLVDLRDRPELVEEFKAKNLMTAPIVVTDTRSWAGFKPEKIISLASYIRSLEKKSE